MSQRLPVASSRSADSLSVPSGMAAPQAVPVRDTCNLPNCATELRALHPDPPRNGGGWEQNASAVGPGQGLTAARAPGQVRVPVRLCAHDLPVPPFPNVMRGTGKANGMGAPG